MRDFTQSMLRFSWAMSLFGVQQVANLLAPSKAAKAFEDVAQAAEAELGNLLKGTFRAGDALQRGFVDRALGSTPGPQAPPSIEEVRAQVLRMLDTLPVGMPLAAIVLFKVGPAKERRFQQEADVLTAATRKLPGCNVFAFHKTVVPASTTEPVEYLIYEDWETRELFHTQWTSQHLKHFQSFIGDLVLAAPDLRFYSGWREYRGRVV